MTSFSPHAENDHYSETCIAIFYLWGNFQHAMKLTEKLKMKGEMLDAMARLQDLLSVVHGLRELGHEITVSDEHPWDFRIRLEHAGAPWVLWVEYKNLGHPRQVIEACRAACAALANHVNAPRVREGDFGIDPIAKDSGICAVLAAPYLSEESRAICEEMGVSWFDLSGNARISFGSVFLREVGHANQFRRASGTKSLFASKARRVIGEMLEAPQQRWRVKPLAEAAEVSFGTISNVRKHLADQRWLGEDKDGFFLCDPEATLRGLAKAGPAPERHETFYTVHHGKLLQERLSSLMAESDGVVLGATSAADWHAPYVREATLHLYVRDEDALSKTAEALDLQSAARGPNVRLAIPAEDALFHHTVPVSKGQRAASMVQTYVDLMQGNDRWEEAADHLLRTKLRQLLEGKEAEA